MSVYKNKIKLSDIIDLEFLQEFQDFFSKTMGVASITVDDAGPITKPSNFTDFCVKYAMGNEFGYKRCNESDIKWGKIAAKKSKPVIYDCYSGLRNFAVPIIIGGEHVASILGGQVLVQKPDIAKFRKLAKVLGVDEEPYIDALRKIKIIPTKQVDSAANFLFLIANAISKIGYKNLQLIRKNEREQVLREIISTIGNCLNLEEIKKEIITRIGKYLGADRVLWVDFNSKTGKYTVTKQGEYKPSKKLKSLCGFDFTSIPGFVENIRSRHMQGEDVIFEDLDEYLKEKGSSIESLNSFFKEEGFVTFLAININYGELYFGNIAAAFAKKTKISSEDIEFLKIIAKQAGFAINQSKLYKETEEQLKRENILRSIIEEARINFDINKLKKKIVDEIGKLLNVNRCFVVTLDYKTDKFNILDEYSVYHSGSDVKKITGFDPEAEELNFFMKNIKSLKSLITLDTESFVKENNLEDTGIDRFFKYYNVKTVVSFPIFYPNLLIGVLVLQYDKKNIELTQNDIDFIEITSKQIGIALYQNFLYQKEKQTGLELKSILDNIPYWAWLKDKEGRFFVINKQYAKDQNLKPEDFIGKTDFDIFPKEIAEMYVNDDRFVIESKEPKTTEIEDAIIQGQKRLLETFRKPLFDDSGEVIGTVGIAKDITEKKEAEKQLLLNQEEIIKAKNRESLLKKIFEKIRSSLDIDETLSFICEETAKIFNVQRTAITVFPDMNNFEVFEFKKEYRATPEIKSLLDAKHLVKLAASWGGALIESKKVLSIDDIVESDAPDYFKEAYGSIGVKAIMGTAIRKEDNVWGTLVLSDYNSSRYWSEDEKILLQAIADQVYMAINQAELFVRVKQTAEREKISRKIIETVRSSLDLKIVKKNLLKELCQAFNADRCYFRSYDKQKGLFLAPDVEYLSSDKVTSLVNIEPDQEGLSFFIEEIKKQNRGFYPLVIDRDLVKEVSLQRYLESANIAVDYAVPIIDRKEELNWLVLHYSNKENKLSEEDKRLLETIAYQIDIAFEQIKLYNDTKNLAEREKLLRKIIESSRKSLIFEESLTEICKVISDLLGIERVSIGKIPEDKISKSFVIIEHKLSDDIKTSSSSKDFGFIQEYWAKYIIENFKTKIITNILESDLPERVKDIYYNEMGVKSIICLPLGSKENPWGGLFLVEYSSNLDFSEEQIELLETIASQVYIAIRQSEMYEREKKNAVRENLLRNVSENIRSSLDIEETLTFICEETAKILNVQRSTMVMFPDRKDYTYFELKKEYKAYPEIKGFSEIPEIFKVAQFWGEKLENEERIYAINNVLESEAPDYFKKAYSEVGIKSVIGVVVTGENEIWGDLVLSDYVNYRVWTEDEKEFLKAITQQIYIAIKQAELYEKQKQAAEREKISRNIIEILRSSIDKTIIKKLFVKNIGKFFNADRVFFSEYSPAEKMFLPVDSNSEYLSNSEEMSFIGFDWSNPDARYYIQPLLEKREVKIPNWEKFIKQMQDINESFLNFHKETKAISSYEFPIIYQDKILGFFCIEFTKRIFELTEEDLGRIRSICTQAGIAMYHADLYLQSQSCNISKESFMSEIVEKISAPTNNILDTSSLLIQNEFERSIQVDYLNNIISSCNQLIELTKEIS